MVQQIISRRRKLLPWWMKFFIWIFMFLSSYGLFMMFWEIIGSPIDLYFTGEVSIYGMETYDKYSLLGIFIITLILFKGLTAFMMWTEKDLAIKFGLIDASVGIIICITMMIVYPIFNLVNGFWNINLRFEILFLIPYLIKCWKLIKPWDELKEPIYQNITPVSEAKTQITIETETELKSELEIEKPSDNNDGLDKEDPRRFMPK